MALPSCFEWQTSLDQRETLSRHRIGKLRPVLGGAICDLIGGRSRVRQHWRGHLLARIGVEELLRDLGKRLPRRFLLQQDVVLADKRDEL